MANIEKRSLTTLGILLLIALGFYATIYAHTRAVGGADPHLFIRPNNLGNLLGQASIVGILACGMTLVIVAGQIDLSVGSMMGMLAAVNACLLTAGRAPLLEWPAGVALLFALFLGAILGAGQGMVISFLRVPAFVVTLGGLMAFRGVLILLASQSVTIQSPVIQTMGGGYLPLGGAVGLIVAGTLLLMWTFCSHREATAVAEARRPGFPRACIAAIGMAAPLGFLLLWLYHGHGQPRGGNGLPLRCVILAGLAVVLHVVATRLRFGRYLFAIGSNATAARYSGIPVEWHLVGVFALMGGCAALAGVVNSGRLMAAGADAGDLMELYAIAACVIGGTSLSGGRGSIAGSILGALIMATLRNGLSLLNVPNSVEKILLGAILITAVALDLALNRKTARN
ncbi:MAG: sugar ABC transporter permease [Verrucomicrobia bacterium]|nr:sugar ABC transporter permease [Verrucomicrobiota bacterium]